MQNSESKQELRQDCRPYHQIGDQLNHHFRRSWQVQSNMLNAIEMFSRENCAKLFVQNLHPAAMLQILDKTGLSLPQFQ